MCLFLLTGCQNFFGEAHTHTFLSEWSHDDSAHWHAATCEHRLITDKVVYSTEVNLRVESFFRSYIPDEGDPVDYYPIGVLKYDTNNMFLYILWFNEDTIVNIRKKINFLK